MRTGPARSKYWCITINNPDLTIWRCELAVQALFETNLKYFVWQIEKGAEETTHVQGYIELEERWRFNQLKAILRQAHIETRKGTAEQARDYCCKESTRIHGPYTIGTFQASKLNAKAEMEVIKNKLKDGCNLKDIMNDHFMMWARYHNSIQKFHSLIAPPRNFKSNLIVCIGPTGTGKSRWAHDTYPSAYWKQRGDWWDGYEQNETVIIDDFYGWWKFDTLLRLTDRYPYQVETKGSHSNFVAKTIIITSNTTPKHWYKNIPNIDAFYRRIDEIKYFPSLDTIVNMSLIDAKLTIDF